MRYAETVAMMLPYDDAFVTSWHGERFEVEL